MTFGLENLFIFGKFSDFYYRSPLFTQNDEFCLQKYPQISDEVSITNHLKQNAIDYLGHLTIEISWRSKKCSYFENKHNSTSRTKRMGTSIGVGSGTKGTISPKILAFLVILFFERGCRKQNTVARFKWKDLPAPNLWAGYATIGTRRDKHPKNRVAS